MPVPVPKPHHRRRVPKRVNRGKFDRFTRQLIFERDEGKCRQCGSKGEHIHHIYLRSQGGRGVFTNGMVVCNDCHVKIHNDYSLLRYWQERFKKLYGDNYFKDEWDGKTKKIISRN